MVSAVIVNHKNFKFLPPLIDSLKKEGIDEIVLVDNSKEEKEREKLKKLKEISLYLLEENKGLGQALNFGSKKANGDLLLFCNPDLLFKNGSVEELKKEIKNFDSTSPFFFWDEEEEFCLPYPYLYNFSFEFLKNLFPEIALNLYLKYEFRIWKSQKPLNLPLLSGSCFLIKKDVFEKLRGFDENYFLYFEENDFFKRFKKNGFKGSLVPSSKVIHFFNLNKSEIHNKYFEESKKIYEKKYFNLIQGFFLRISSKFSMIKEKNFKELRNENIEGFSLVLSPFSNFIPSIYIKKSKNWAELEEKLKKISFFEGYIGLLGGNSILKSFHFKVK